MKSIFEYTDYRKYLEEFYREKKAKNNAFSYRFMANHVGFKSAGHFTKIIQGKANISIALALRFAEFLKFNQKQTEYFQNLVLYNQAKNHQDKCRYFEKMLYFKDAGITTINTNQYGFFEEWYYIVVREILAYFPCKDNFAELASLVVPPISEKDAKKAVETLVRLGFVSKDSEGYYRQSNPLIMAEQHVISLADDNFIINNINLAREAIDRFPKDQRKLSATTVTISNETYEIIVRKLYEFRMHVLTLAQLDQNPERTYQINFQMFPVTMVAPSVQKQN